MKQTIVFLFALAMNFNTAAQKSTACNHHIKGVILDKDTKAPLPFVKVAVKGVSNFALTDINGEFRIENLCNESNTLIISCFGYCDEVCEDYHQHGKHSHIYLKHKVENLSGLTISAEKTKEEGIASISQIKLKKDDLTSNSTQSLAAAISQVDGVTFTSMGTNVQLPVIHGLYGNRVLIVNNGLKHGFQNWGSDHAPEIDIAGANSITVLKGAAGVKYGPEALGGAIVVEGDPLHLNEPLNGKVEAGYQTNGKGYYGNFEIGEGLEHFSYHAGINYKRIGDRKAPDYNLTNSGKKEIGFNTGVRYHLEDWDFKVYYSYFDQNLALLRSSVAESLETFNSMISGTTPRYVSPFSYDINEPNQLTEHHLIKAEVSWWYSDDAKLSLIVGQQLNKRQEFDVRRNADRPIIDLDLTTNDYQLEWKHPDWYGLDGLIGLQLYTQNSDNNPGTGTTAFIPNYNTTRYSGFLLESLRRGKNTFELGLRLDYENNNIRGRTPSQDIFRDDYTFSNITTSLGYIRQISVDETFRSNIGTAWRTPNVAELYSYGQHGFKVTYGLLRYNFNSDGELRASDVTLLEDSEVKPEKGYKWIHEWEKQHNTNRYTITGYTNYIENFIYDRPGTLTGSFRGPMPAYIIEQKDALFAGVDFTWKKELSKTLDGTFGANYLWSRNIEDDQPLINQPPIATRFQLDWKLKDIGMLTDSKIKLNTSYFFKQFQAPITITPEELIETELTIDSPIFDFKDAPDGYFLMDVAWSFKVRQFNGSLAIDNVFNTNYRNYLNEMRYFANDLGRNILLTINYTF